MLGNYFKNVFGLPYLDSNEKMIMIGGINANHLIDDIKRIWNSEKFALQMFYKISSNSVIFYKFWALDIFYMLEQIALYKKRRSSLHRIKTCIELLQKNTWLKSMISQHEDILNMSLLKKMHHSLFDHQIEALKVYNETIPKMRLKGYLLNAIQGSGKTIMSIALATALDVEKMVIVCPKSLVNDVWFGALQDEFGTAIKIWKSTDEIPITNDYKYYVIHYEYLSKLLLSLEVFKNKHMFIVLDESHNLNEITSLRTQNFIQFVRQSNCQHTVFSSGTPVKAMGSEMIPLFYCLDRFFNDDTAEQFKKVYGLSAQRGVDVLRYHLDLIGHKITKLPEIVINEPEVHQIRVKIPNGNQFTIDSVKEQMRVYSDKRARYYQDNMKEILSFYENCLSIYEKTIRTSIDRRDFDKYKQYIKEIRRGYDPQIHQSETKFCNQFEKTKIIPVLPQVYKNKFRDIRAVVKYVQLKILGETLGNVLTKARVECHEQIIKYANLEEIINNADKKVIFFSDYTNVIKTANEYFMEKGFKPVIIYGETAKDINTSISNFRHNPKDNPLIASLKMVATGLTLTVANVVVFLNLPFRDYIKQQAISRVHRIGQDTQTHVYEVTLDTGNTPNISTRMQDILEWSKQQTDAILGKNIDSDDLVGIVEYFNMNPKTTFEKFISKFRNLF